MPGLWACASRSNTPEDAPDVRNCSRTVAKREDRELLGCRGRSLTLAELTLFFLVEVLEEERVRDSPGPDIMVVRANLGL